MIPRDVSKEKKALSYSITLPDASWGEWAPCLQTTHTKIVESGTEISCKTSSYKAIYLSTLVRHFSLITRNIFTVNDVLDGTDEAENSSECSNDDGLNTQHFHQDTHLPETLNISILNMRRKNIFASCQLSEKWGFCSSCS